MTTWGTRYGKTKGIGDGEGMTMPLVCLDCGKQTNVLSMDLKCFVCETKASTSMLGGVVLLGVAWGVFVGVGVVAYLCAGGRLPAPW